MDPVTELLRLRDEQIERVRERYEFDDSPAMQAFKKANPGYATGFDPAKHPGPWWNGER